MIHRWRCIVALVTLVTCGLHAQQLDPFVINSTGGSYAFSAGSLTYSIAELAAVESIADHGFILTQGFLQPFDFMTNTAFIPMDDQDFSLFPNPSNGYLILQCHQSGTVIHSLQIIDLLGTIRFTQIVTDPIREKFEFFLNDLAPGYYLLQCVQSKNGSNQTQINSIPFTIIK